MTLCEGKVEPRGQGQPNGGALMAVAAKTLRNGLELTAAVVLVPQRNADL